jgi:hypothetical protein
MEAHFAGINWKYALPAGLAGAITSMVLVAVLYTAANPILFNPAYQGAKVIAVYQSIQPLPLLTSNPAALAAGWILVSMVRTLVFAWFYKGIPGTGIRKGIAWGIAVWLTVVLFSEFYTAINLLGEPLYLAAFEMFLILWAFIGEGSVVATIYHRASPDLATVPQR